MSFLVPHSFVYDVCNLRISSELPETFPVLSDTVETEMTWIIDLIEKVEWKF